jgi:hypothetical protein
MEEHDHAYFGKVHRHHRWCRRLGRIGRGRRYDGSRNQGVSVGEHRLSGDHRGVGKRPSRPRVIYWSEDGTAVYKTPAGSMMHGKSEIKGNTNCKIGGNGRARGAYAMTRQECNPSDVPDAHNWPLARFFAGRPQRADELCSWEMVITIAIHHGAYGNHHHHGHHGNDPFWSGSLAGR